MVRCKPDHPTSIKRKVPLPLPPVTRRCRGGGGVQTQSKLKEEPSFWPVPRKKSCVMEATPTKESSSLPTGRAHVTRGQGGGSGAWSASDGRTGGHGSCQGDGHGLPGRQALDVAVGLAQPKTHVRSGQQHRVAPKIAREFDELAKTLEKPAARRTSEPADQLCAASVGLVLEPAERVKSRVATVGRERSMLTPEPAWWAGCLLWQASGGRPRHGAGSSSKTYAEESQSALDRRLAPPREQLSFGLR
jgi:hypothetical protein